MVEVRHKMLLRFSKSLEQNTRADPISRRAASWSPGARVIASGGEGQGVRPRATDAQLVGGGQGVCALPSRKGDGAGLEAEGRIWGGSAAQAACTGHGEKA